MDHRYSTAAGDLRLLVDAEARLARLTAEAEPAFQPVADLLARSVTSLRDMANCLRDLGLILQGHETERTVDALQQALHGVDDIMMARERDGSSALPKLSEQADQILTHWGQLHRIISEITALAINGKIQAAMVTTEGTDFSVFTSEIGRLGSLAAQQIDQSLGRLAIVRQSIAAASAAQTSFAQEEATELLNVRERIARNIAKLVERQRHAATMIDAVSLRSRLVSERVAETVGELQINDITCQRLEHVRTVLRRILENADSQTAWDPGLASAACHLQSRQLAATASEYKDKIDSLIAHLQGLSGDSAALLSDANQVLADDQGGLFLDEIERGVSRALALLDAYEAADQRIQQLMQAVSRGFSAMTLDLQAIRSIDADMRIMALNATLKCGRLGNSGRALGVVAQELRACSLRTEDMSHRLVAILEKALSLVGSLALSESEEGLAVGQTDGGPSRIMAQSVTELRTLSVTMSEGFGTITRLAAGLGDRLTEGATAIDFHHRLGSVTDQARDGLAAFVGPDQADRIIDPPLQSGLADLTAGLYTMDSERIVHQEFAGGELLLSTSDSSALDDLFF